MTRRLLDKNPANRAYTIRKLKKRLDTAVATGRARVCARPACRRLHLNRGNYCSNYCIERARQEGLAD